MTCVAFNINTSLLHKFYITRFILHNVYVLFIVHIFLSAEKDFVKRLVDYIMKQPEGGAVFPLQREPTENNCIFQCFEITVDG